MNEPWEHLAKAGRWEEALPVIQAILTQAPELDTSWFNLGVCLEELGRPAEAANAFIKAQELNLHDLGIHYRIIRSLFLAADFAQLADFVEYSCALNQRVMFLICEDQDFRSLFERPEFQALRAKYLK